MRNPMPISPEIAELFIERFPRYAFSLPTWTEGTDVLPGADQEWLRALPLEHAEVLYIYGLGDGSSAVLLQDWLKKHPAHRLIFLEPRTDRIVQFLTQPLAKEALQSSQIEIFHLSTHGEKTRLLQELAERYPMRGVFLEPAPHCSAQDRPSLSRTRIQLLRKTALTHAVFVDRFMNHIPLSHLVRHSRHFSSNFYANRLKDAFQGIPAIICGAGPSLQRSIDDLRQMEHQALIFAGGSAIAALSRQGITPHFAIAIDPNPEEFHRLKNSFAFEAPLLFSSRLFPDCLAALNGPFGYVRSGMSGISELWLDEQLQLTEPIFGEHLPAESLSVTTLAAAIAYYFGCNPILFDGLDLAYTQNRRYAEGVMAEEEAGDQGLQPVDRHLMKKDRQGKPVMSAVRWIMESSALSKLAKRYSKRRFVNCTQGGIGIKGLETMTLAEMRASFSQMRDLRGLIHSAIQRAPMPPTQSKVSEKIEELRKSLDNVLAHLEILAANQSAGKCALAEIELKEELASAILFCNIEQTISSACSNPEKGPAYWKAFQERAMLAKRSFDQ